MTRYLVVLIPLLTSCGGRTYDAACGAGGPACGEAGVCNEGTQWAARKCLPGDKCVDGAKRLCEQVLSK